MRKRRVSEPDEGTKGFSRSVAMRISMALTIAVAALAILPASIDLAGGCGRAVDVRNNQRVKRRHRLCRHSSEREFQRWRHRRGVSGSSRQACSRMCNQCRRPDAVISVEEYALINEVIFQGNRKLKDNALTNVVQRSRAEHSRSPCWA